MAELTPKQQEILDRVQARRKQKAAPLTARQQEILAGAKERRRQNMGYGEWAGDLAKSGGIGLVEGTVGMAGLPSDIRELTSAGVSKAAGFFGADEEKARKLTNDAIYYSNMLNPVTAAWQQFGPSRDIQGTIEDQTGKFYEPKSTTGKYVKSIGAFVPGAITGGGGIPRMAMTAVAGGIGAEGAGQATEGTAYEPYARFIGGLGGSLGGMKLADIMTSRVPGQTAGSLSLLRDNSDGALPALQATDNVDMLLNANGGMSGLAQGIVTKGGKPGQIIREALEKQMGGKADRLKINADNILGKAKDLTTRRKAMDRLTARKAGPLYEAAKQNAQPLPPGIRDILAKQLTDPAAFMTKSKRAAAMKVMEDIDDALSHSDPSDVAANLHSLRKELDGKIVYDREAMKGLPSGEKEMQDVLRTARDSVDDILKNRLGFDKADEIFSTNAKAKADMEMGYDALDNGKYAMSPPVFANRLAKGDKLAVNTGIRARIENMMGTQQNDLLALKKGTGGAHDWNRKKLVQALGEKKVDDLVGMVNREAKRDRDFQDILGNSRTAGRLEAVKQIEGQAGKKTDLSQLSAIGAGAKVTGAELVYNKLKDALLSRKSAKSNAALAKALSLPKADAIKLLEAVGKVQGLNGVDLARAIAFSFANAKPSSP